MTAAGSTDEASCGFEHGPTVHIHRSDRVQPGESIDHVMFSASAVSVTSSPYTIGSAAVNVTVASARWNTSPDASLGICRSVT